MKDPIELGPYAILIDHGPDAGPKPLGPVSWLKRQVSPSGVREWLPPNDARAPCIRWGASTQASNPSAQGWADRAPGVRSLTHAPTKQCNPQWKYLQCTVPALQYKSNRTMKSIVNSLTVNSSPRYRETLINFSYS
jgi:hypothetical protein